MIVRVKRNYLSDQGKILGPGDVVALDEDVAKRFLASGQVEEVESPEIEAVVKEEEAKEAAEEPAMTLPEPDIRAAKKRK